MNIIVIENKKECWYCTDTLFLTKTCKLLKYHLSKHRHIEFTSVNILCILRFLKRFRDNACVASWVEELEADRTGCRWYGSREIFLQKMRKMEELYPEKKAIFYAPDMDNAYPVY